VGLRDVVFGRKKLAEPKDDRLFALATAAVTLETECNLTTDGVAAVVFKPLSSGDFTRVDNDAEALIKSAATSAAGSDVDRKTDSFGFEWVVIHDPALENQITSVHAVAQELTDQGFGAQLLAAPFRFKGGDHPVYWIYGFKLGAFYPFVPTGQGQERDNAAELELQSKLEEELPIERDLTKWFGLFDGPI
jgi:hypothetical protein